MVEYGHVVGGEGADPAVAALFEVWQQVLKALEEHPECPAVVLGEPIIGLVVVVEVSIRVGVRLGAHVDRNGPALEPWCPHPLSGIPGVGVHVVLDHLAVVAVDGCVHQLDVEDRAVLTVGGAVVDSRGKEDLAL